MDDACYNRCSSFDNFDIGEFMTAKHKKKVVRKLDAAGVQLAGVFRILNNLGMDKDEANERSRPSRKWDF